MSLFSFVDHAKCFTEQKFLGMDRNNFNIETSLRKFREILTFSEKTWFYLNIKEIITQA